MVDQPKNHDRYFALAGVRQPAGRGSMIFRRPGQGIYIAQFALLKLNNPADNDLSKAELVLNRLGARNQIIDPEESLTINIGMFYKFERVPVVMTVMRQRDHRKYFSVSLFGPRYIDFVKEESLH
jgi:hypothetical protein